MDKFENIENREIWRVADCIHKHFGRKYVPPYQGSDQPESDEKTNQKPLSLAPAGEKRKMLWRHPVLKRKNYEQMANGL